MKILLVPAATIAIATTASAETDTFDKASTGSLPAALTCGVTGRGSPKWTIESDPTAPSQPNVLKQSGSGTFPWCVWKGGSITDGYAEVKFKPLEGREDQAGGSYGAGRMATTTMWREPTRWKTTFRFTIPRKDVESPSATLMRPLRGTNGTRCV